MKLSVYVEMFHRYLIFLCNRLHGQKKSKDKNLIYADKQAVLPRRKIKSEASFSAINYIVPFAYGYPSYNALEKDLKKGIGEGFLPYGLRPLQQAISICPIQKNYRLLVNVKEKPLSLKLLQPCWKNDRSIFKTQSYVYQPLLSLLIFYLFWNDGFFATRFTATEDQL